MSAEKIKPEFYRYKVTAMVSVSNSSEENEHGLIITPGSSPACIANNHKTICWFINVDGSELRDTTIKGGESSNCLIEVISNKPLDLNKGETLKLLNGSQYYQFEKGEKYLAYALAEIESAEQI